MTAYQSPPEPTEHLWRIVHYLESAGPTGVLAAADVAKSLVLLVQCKLPGAGAVPPAEWNGMAPNQTSGHKMWGRRRERG